MSDLQRPTKHFCNHCQTETHVTKDADCLVCGLSFPTGSMMYTEIQTLKDKLTLAIEALEEIAEDFGTDYCDGNTMIAHETLKKIRG